jgi:hypothetical protein
MRATRVDASVGPGSDPRAGSDAQPGELLQSL